MKKFLYTLFFISLAFTSCIEKAKSDKDASTQTSEIEKKTIETFKLSISKFGKDSNDVKTDSVAIVFSTDNLCILHANVSGVESQNKVNKVEYIFLSQDGKYYEAFQNLNEDSIYISEYTYKHTDSAIFESMDYKDFIIYRSIVNINLAGREVESHNRDFLIQSPIDLGLWQLGYMKDEFGDLTSVRSILLVGKGTFQTKKGSEKPLLSVLSIDENNKCFMRFLEDRSHLVDDFSGSFKIKDGEGDVHNIYFSSNSQGQIVPVSYSEKEFREIIEKEGVLSVIAKENSTFNYNPKTYHFKFYLDGLKKAMVFFKPDEGIYLNQLDESEFNDNEIDTDNEPEKYNDFNSDKELESVNMEQQSQHEKESTMGLNNDNSKVYDIVDEAPFFPGGPSALLEYLSKAIQYPVEAEENGVQGKVICSFVIERDGSISNVKVIKGVDPSLDKEAKRVIKTMPKWIPGMLNGTAVRVKYTVPVTFGL